MKIEILGSITPIKKITELQSKLEKIGYEAIIPPFHEQYLSLDEKGIMKESSNNKKEHDIIRKYFDKIKNCDVVLVANYEKKGIPGYIGSNVLIELAFAHVLGKKKYLLNPLPDLPCRDELIAMNPIILNGDLNKIK